MVPSPPAAARPAHPAQPELDRLATIFALARRRVLVVVRLADAAHAGAILAVVRAAAPDAAWCTSAVQLLELAPGSTAVLWVDPGDLEGLNLVRERFREEDRRVVFLVTAGVADRFRLDAPDLYDWIAHRLDLTTAPPAWAVESAAAAVALGARLSWWGPGPPDPALRHAAPGWDIHTADASTEWTALLAAARRPGWRVWTGVTWAADEVRVRWAEALAGAEGACVLDRPDIDIPGYWRVHAEVVAPEPAPIEAELASGFEPEALGCPPARTATEPPWADVATDDDARLAACRPVGPALRALEPAAWAAACATLDARVAGDLAGWPPVIELPAFGRGTTPVAGLAAETGRLSDYARSTLVERALRTTGVDRTAVEAAGELRHLDIASAWVASLPLHTPEERGWASLLALLAEEGEAVWTQRSALETMLAAPADDALRAAIGARLGQARLDALDIDGALAAFAEARRWESVAWRRADLEFWEREARMEDARAGPEPVVPERDSARAARADLQEAAVLRGLGRRADAKLRTARGESALAALLVEPVWRSGIGVPTPRAGQGRSKLAYELARVVANAERPAMLEALHAASPRLRLAYLLTWQSARGVAPDLFAPVFGSFDVRAVRRAAALARTGAAVAESDWSAAAAAARRLLAGLDESAAGPLDRILLLAATARERHDAGDPDSALRAITDAWAAAAETTDPEERANLVAALREVSTGRPEPRLARWLRETLDNEWRYPDEESAHVRPRMLVIAEDALAEARDAGHRARSQRRSDEAERWRKQERALAALLAEEAARPARSSR